MSFARTTDRRSLQVERLVEFGCAEHGRETPGSTAARGCLMDPTVEWGSVRIGIDSARFNPLRRKEDATAAANERHNQPPVRQSAPDAVVAPVLNGARVRRPARRCGYPV